MPTEQDQAAKVTPKTTPANKDKKKKDQEDELSPEDQQLKQELELLVERAKDPKPELQKAALESLKSHIRSSTTSMTSVPKPLKFLRPFYPELVTFYNDQMEYENKTDLADVLSVLAMTMGKEGERESLKYKLVASKEPVGSWGHEYVRHIAGEVAAEYEIRQTENRPVDDLMRLVDEMVPFHMQHNAEPEACDLLMEVNGLSKIVDYVDESNYVRVCLYLIGCSKYVPDPQDTEILRICTSLYLKVNQYPDAMRIAVRIGDAELIKSTYEACADRTTKRQLAFMLARHRLFTVVEDEENADVLNHTNLSESFLTLGKDLDIMEAKTPEDIYKSNLSETRPGFSASVDSARQNLAATFVNAFVNCGFGQDKFMTEEGKNWVYKNKEHGMMSATASLGMILQWNVDEGLSQIDKYLYSPDDYVKAGALLAVGIVNSGVRNEIDPALALLNEFVENKTQNANIRTGAILGLGLAYAGTNRRDIADLLTPILEESGTSIELIAHAGLALGLVFAATTDADISQAIIQALLERDEAALSNAYTRFLILGLGLLYLGKQSAAELTLETLKALPGTHSQFASLIVEGCAYAGSGHVLKVQKMLHACSDHLEENNAHQAIAVIGISLIAMGEELGSEMALRTFDHLLQYGEPVIRRSVPLALGLLSVSNPQISVMDTLSKLSHDHDVDVAQGAIFGLGLIGAGTNNARVAGMLRSLAQYYYKDPNHLFAVRVAQGLLHMGKGTITLSPFYNDRMLLSPTAVGGLLTVLFACTDLKNLLLSKAHYLLFSLCTAMFPRMLMTLDEDLKPLAVPVRVGEAVDVVGQAGKPKTITGFQTHTTPVLLGHRDRAELATDDYVAATSVLEGFVILKPNTAAGAVKKTEKK